MNAGALLRVAPWVVELSSVRRLGLRVGVGGLLASLPLTFAALLAWEPGSLGADVAYLVPVVLALGLMVVAVPQVPAQRRRPWLWLTAAMVMYVVGESLFAVLDVLGNESWPTPADAVYLAAYFPVTVGLLSLNRQRGGAGHRGSLLDACIVTLSAATLFGVFVVLPIADDASQAMLVRVTSAAYPMADVLLIFLLARMTTGPGARTTAFWLLAGGTLATLVADVAMILRQFAGAGDDTPAWMNVLWLTFYASLSLAACSESAHRLSEKKPRTDAGLTVPRLLLLALAAVLPSAILFALAATRRDSPTAWLALGSVLLVGLVVTRIWDLLQQVRTQAALLAALARTDPLTGAANRRTWDHELSRACATVAENGDSLYVALLDLDHFKAYNDTHGHPAGDALLKAVTAAWSAALDGTGFLARWGGEEFAVLLQAADDVTALRRLDALRLVLPGTETVSVGVSRWDGAEDPAGLLRRADDALYAAKTGGRNRLAVAPELAGGRRPERGQRPDAAASHLSTGAR